MDRAYLTIDSFHGKPIYAIAFYEKTRDETVRKQIRIEIANDEMTGFRFMAIDDLVQLMKKDIETRRAVPLTNPQQRLQNVPYGTPIKEGRNDA